MRPVLLVLVSVVNLAGTTCAFEYVTSRGNGLGGTVVLSNPAASDILVVPTARHARPGIRIEAGINRQFDLQEFDRAYLAAGFRRYRFSAAVGLAQFGRGDLYAERTSRLSAAFHHDSFSLGAMLSIMQVDFAGHYADLTGHSLGIALSYRAGPVIAAFVVDDLNSPRLDEHSETTYPTYTAYAELIGPGPYSVTGRLTAQKYEKPQFGVGQMIRVSRSGSLFWGLATAPLTYGAGLELIHKRSLITYATSYHPTLGFSHTLSVCFTVGGIGSDTDGKSQERRY